MKRLYLIIGLIVFMFISFNCVESENIDPIIPVIPVVNPRPYETPDMVTAFGINVWLGGYKINPDELDQYFLEVVDELGYGPVDLIDLIISPTHCREYPDGLTYCGFEDPDVSFMLAGRFYYHGKLAIKIHLMFGEWGFKESALSHEIEHYVMYIYQIPGWNINNEYEYTISQSEGV